jgi:hypothetical protein
MISSGEVTLTRSQKGSVGLKQPCSRPPALSNTVSHSHSLTRRNSSSAVQIH